MVGPGGKWLAQGVKWLVKGVKWLAQGVKRLAQGFKWLAHGDRWLAQGFKWLAQGFKWLAVTVCTPHAVKMVRRAFSRRRAFQRQSTQFFYFSVPCLSGQSGGTPDEASSTQPVGHGSADGLAPLECQWPPGRALGPMSGAIRRAGTLSVTPTSPVHPPTHPPTHHTTDSRGCEHAAVPCHAVKARVCGKGRLQLPPLHVRAVLKGQIFFFC